MANAWDEYKKKHGISDQPAQQAETENAWERYKRETGIESGTDIWKKKVQNRAEASKRNREAQTQERRNLYAQKREIDNFTGPQPIGGEDAMKANYYSNLNQYGAKYGDAAAQDEGYRNYRQAMANVDKAYASEIEKNRRQDAAYDTFRQAAERIMPFQSELSRAGRELTVQDQRYARDTNLYNQMGQAANQTGSKALWDKAAQGYEQANADYMKSFNAYGDAYNDRQQKELERLRTEDTGRYTALTTDADAAYAKYDELTARKAELEAKRDEAERVLQNLKMSGQVTNIDSSGVGHYGQAERDYDAIVAEIAKVNTQLDWYTDAKKFHDNEKGRAIYDQYLAGGKVLPPDVVRKSETGKAKYEADRKAAEEKGAETLDYGWNIVRKTRGVWRTEKDRLEEAGWDPTFDDASNLNSQDQMLFYALYADDPKEAMLWATYANNLRNEEYEGYMQEWAGENGVNAGAAFFQALGNRIGSGAVNLVDPHSAEANQLARTASGLLAGGGQLLNEWSGTIDTDIPIVRDILNGKGLGDFYQIANSIVESGINAYAAKKLGAFIPGGGESGVAALGVMLMGSSASAADYNECIKRGLTPGQAQKHALAAGINEALFEFVSLDKLLDEEKLMMASTVSEKIKGVFAQAGVEASEEFCTTVANRLADAAQARRDGYDTQIEQRAKELIALGLSRDEAMEKAEKEWLTDLINDAIGGFISGGGLKLGAYAVSAPARAAVNAVQNARATNKVNEIRGSFTSAEEAAALRSFAETNGVKVGERVAQSTEENATENAPTAEQEAKLSRREIRQERRANRETGALESEVVKKLSETVHERGLNSAQEIFNEQTQHGAAITRVVQQAIVNEARTVFAQAQNQSELTKAYQQAVETATAKRVKQALKQAYQDATTLRAYQGDKEAMTDALIGGGSGRALDLSAELTASDGSTQNVQIKALNSEKGKVVLDNGSTVALDELQGLDADTKDVIQRLDAFELGEARPLAFLAYQTAVEKGDVTDGTRWVMSWALAFDQGRNGAISVDEAVKRSSLPEDVVRSAYELGEKQTETWRRQKEAENAKKREKADDGATGRKGILDTSALTKEQYDSLSADKKDALRTLELIAEATGVDIRLITNKVTKRGNVKGYQGLYNKDGNYIEIDVNAGINNIFEDLHTGMTAVLGHELTHWMQENAPTEYLAYKKAVLQAIMSTKNGELTLERMVEAQINQNKREGKEITRSQAEDEVVADASMKRMGDTEFWDAVANNLGDKKADVFAKIKEYISQFFNRVREIIGKASHTSEAAKIIDRVEADVQDTLRRLYAEGIGAAMRNSSQTGTETKNTATEGGEVQYSIRQTNNGQLYVQADRQVLTDDDPVQWGKQIEDYINKVIRNGEDFVVPTRDGSHFLALTSRSAYKLSDRHVQERRHDGVKRLLSDAQYHRKGVAATHIDELIQVATFKGYDEDFDGWHENDIGEDGFNYFNAFFRDFDGSYYKAFFSSALNEEEETAFSIGNIERRRFPDRNGSSSQGEALQSGGKPSTENDSTNGVESQAPKTALAAALEKAQAEKEAKRSTRDYSDVSDLDLLLNAAEEISEGGGEDYWDSLLSEEPGLANETAEIKRLGKQLKKTEAELAEAQRNLTLTDRKLKTRGIASLAATIMRDQKAGDINKKDVKNRITAVLTEAYQKALDQLDAGADVGSAWETVYSEGVVKAADILLMDATYAEKLGYKWYKNTLGAYLGEGAREYVEADIGARVAEDFQANRYRPGQKGTVADRLVAQAENRVNKKLTAAKTENAALKAKNAKLSEDKAFFKEQAETAAKTAKDLYEQLVEKRDELKNNTKISAQDRKATLKRLDNMERQMKAKRREAEAWKSKAETGWKAASQAIRERDAAVEKLEKQLQRERDILEGKLKPPAIQKMLAAAREREGKRIAEQKDERFAAYKEKQKAAELRSRIKNLSDEMKRKMTRPTDGSYVPASLYGAMTQVADLLDNALAPKAGTKAEAKYRAMMDAIHALQSEYGKVAEMDDYTYKSEFDAEIMDEIKELEEVLTKDQSWVMAASNDNRSLREYSFGDLTRIYEILRTINEAMTSASHFLGKAKFQSIWDAMGQIAEQQGDMTSFNRLGWYSKKKRMRMLDSLNVMRAVEMMSNWDRNAALYRIMQQVENGVDVSNAWMMEYNKAMQALKTGKNEKAYRDALTKKLDFNMTDEEGLPVLMTKMQALQLLMTAEREAHNDKLVHLQRGGATIRDALAIQDGKKDAAAQTIKVTPELINRIQKSLTEWDKAYMKAVRDYFGREGKATNHVLYNLKHRVLQTEDYYVPYAVDKNYLDTDLNETQAMNMWVKTPGSTNALQKKASQPVIIDGMDTVMAKHVREIADYIGLAIPIRDFAKVYNGRLKQGEGENPLPVKQTIDKNWKAKGQHLLTQSIIDVQGGSRGASWSTAIAENLNALQSAFVKSALLINPSVTIKQAASYAAAGSILSHAALDRANHPISVKTDESNAFDPATGLIGHIFFAPNGATAMRIYNEIDKYTSLHYMRRQGMSQAELANEANRSGKLKRAMNSVGASMEQTAAGHIARKVGASLNPVSWIQRMDVATTATLWLACKEQARMDGMKVGTDEYWQHVTELYERVIRETQPMYDSLHRNAGQKSRENSLMQYLFPFRTVPIQNHGQIAASYETLQTALKSKDEARIKEAKKFFAKTMWAQTESAIIFSLMSFLAAALKRKTRKYRDEDEEISLESILRGLGSDAAGTMFSNLFPLFGSAIWDSAGNIYDSVKTGKKVWSYDAYSVGVVDLMNEFAKAGENLVTDAANMIAGKDVGWDKLSGDIAGLLEKSLKCIGIPASTIKTYAEGFIGNLNDLPYLFSEGRIPALNDASWERSAAVNANRYLKAWIADDNAKLETVKAEMMGNYAEAGKNEDEANKAMKTKLTATAKDAFAAGTLDMTDAILFLVDTGYYDEDDAWNKVRQWAAENEHEGDEEYKWNQYEDLRAAFDAGTGIEEAIKELEDHGYSDTQLATEISDNIRDALNTGAISEETAIDYLKRYRDMDEDKSWKKVQEWQAKAEHADEEDYSYSQYDAIDAAIDANKEIKDLVSELTAHGVKSESITSHVKQHLVENYVNGSVSETALRNQLSRYCRIVAKDDVDKIVNDAKCRKDTGYAYSALDEAYRSGEVSKTTMKNALMKYGGKTSAEADKKLRWWDLQVSKPSLEISESAANAWYDGTAKSRENGHESAKAAGMSIEAYLKAKDVLDEIKDANDNGSGEDEVIAALAKMNLTARQKDALYYERYKGTTKISKTKSW